MPTLTHELASAPPTNHLCQWPRYASTPTTAPLKSTILTLPHPHLILSATYHAYAPTAPSRYTSDASTKCPPSLILTLLHPCHLPCLCAHSTIKICLQYWHLFSLLTHTYLSAPLLFTMLMLLQHPQDIPLKLPPHVCPDPSLCFHKPTLSSPALTILTLPY
ncbi:hypothetical protein O181_060050 [Austropuccinia psidii MF-1]|uniref:Uncharacterized protein n=1 Tax=Austropuccinia psidii MF-1 TaxID=1389203 RepID=A0A9Q3ECN1_9BASI|nr:hypothetical protein [Austropuccinia psidii MF-1]